MKCGPDGTRCDVDGNVWCSSNAGRAVGYSGVTVWNPAGKLIGRIRVPEIVANICFGGPKRNRLFIAASQSLYALYTATQGAALAEPSQGRSDRPKISDRQSTIRCVNRRFVTLCRMTPHILLIRPGSSVWHARRHAAQLPLSSGFRCTPRRTCQRPRNLPSPRPKPCRATPNSRCRAHTSTHRGRA